MRMRGKINYEGKVSVCARSLTTTQILKLTSSMDKRLDHLESISSINYNFNFAGYR